MDSAHKSNRRYPSYTLAQLEASYARGGHAPHLMSAMAAEIADRKAGISKPFVTPQVARQSPAEKAYEADCARRPTYHDGTRRKTWDELPDYAKQSWR